MLKHYGEMLHHGLWTVSRLIMLLTPLILGETVNAAERATDDAIGMLGLLLKSERLYPTVVKILPGSPADKDGSLRPGDAILAISSNAAQTGFISTRGLPMDRVGFMLRGRPGSAVAVKVSVRNGGDGETEKIIRLRREAPVELELSNGSRAQGLLQSHHLAVLQLSPEEISKLRRVEASEWSRITNGMRTNDLVRMIGAPLESGPGHRLDESSWRYGTEVHIGKESLAPGWAYIYVTNGVVSQNFKIKQPPESDCRVEILSR
jgi:hypothetical protein